MTASHLITGQTAELQARDFLLAQGLQLLQANFRCKLGEIDLICCDQDTLVFVEVRHRPSIDQALASINYSKRRKIIRSAQFYLSQLRDLPPCRFDVVALAPQQEPYWIKAAFDV